MTNTEVKAVFHNLYNIASGAILLRHGGDKLKDYEVTKLYYLAKKAGMNARLLIAAYGYDSVLNRWQF